VSGKDKPPADLGKKGGTLAPGKGLGKPGGKAPNANDPRDPKAGGK
jgi:hypothetical protein